MNWIRVTRRQPCPICTRPDWCSLSEDGRVAVCMRVESDKPCKSGGWYHNLTEPVTVRPAPKPKVKPVATEDFARLAVEYAEQLTNTLIPAKMLGVSVRSLERLQMGWNGKGYTFPMRDGRERVIGIRVRGNKGKWSVPGSHNGLFWPEGVYRGNDSPLMICEGPTDCAALLDLGFAAIGRPSCTGGVEHIVEFLQGRRREVVIVADHDELKRRPDGSTFRPGQEGAARLAQEIKPLVRTVKGIKPPYHKDVRDWVRAGATRAVIESVIRNTRFVDLASARSLREPARASATTDLPAALSEPAGAERKATA